MIFSLDVLRAKKGDCLLLHFGTEGAPGLILIDGGPAGVYAAHLKKRLSTIRDERGLGRGMPLDVDLLMVSHIDDDHIVGILDLTREEIEAQEASRPRRVKVHDFWHNSFDDVAGNLPPELTNAFESAFGAASTTGSPFAEETLDDVEGGSEKTPEEVLDSLKILASVRQGYRLRLDGERLGFPLNSPFDGGLVMCGDSAFSHHLSDEVELLVIGPSKRELLNLQREHDAWIRELAREGKTPSDVLAAYTDRSPSNLSSLVVLVRCRGKSILLTGDARGDLILAAMERTGLLARGGHVDVDVLKVPHHGSARNLDPGFFERVIARHYVFSGNGEHGNPERAALEMLLDARGSEAFSIHFTYPIDEVDVERAKDWEKERRKELRRWPKDPERVRIPWSAEKHALATLFEQRPLGRGQVLEIVPAMGSHVIDLQQPLGY